MDEAALKEQIRQGLVYSMRLLMISKRSESDIRGRMKDKGYADEVIEAVVSQLKDKKYIDDAQLAKTYVQYAAPGKHLGRRRIAFDLRRKGISKDVVSDALSELQQAEQQVIAREAAIKRYRKLSGLDEKAKKKRIYDFLIRRGFDYEVCRSVIEKLNTTDENE